MPVISAITGLIDRRSV